MYPLHEDLIADSFDIEYISKHIQTGNILENDENEESEVNNDRYNVYIQKARRKIVKSLYNHMQENGINGTLYDSPPISNLKLDEDSLVITGDYVSEIIGIDLGDNSDREVSFLIRSNSSEDITPNILELDMEENAFHEGDGTWTVPKLIFNFKSDKSIVKRMSHVIAGYYYILCLLQPELYLKPLVRHIRDNGDAPSFNASGKDLEKSIVRAYTKIKKDAKSLSMGQPLSDWVSSVPEMWHFLELDGLPGYTLPKDFSLIGVE